MVEVAEGRSSSDCQKMTSQRMKSLPEEGAVTPAENRAEEVPEEVQGKMTFETLLYVVA